MSTKGIHISVLTAGSAMFTYPWKSCQRQISPCNRASKKSLGFAIDQDRAVDWKNLYCSELPQVFGARPLPGSHQSCLHICLPLPTVMKRGAHSGGCSWSSTSGTPGEMVKKAIAEVRKTEAGKKHLGEDAGRTSVSVNICSCE